MANLAVCEAHEGLVLYRWTTHEQLLHDGHKNVRKEEEPCVLGVVTEPSFGIGQRALVIQTGALS